MDTVEISAHDVPEKVALHTLQFFALLGAVVQANNAVSDETLDLLAGHEALQRHGNGVREDVVGKGEDEGGTEHLGEHKQGDGDGGIDRVHVGCLDGDGGHLCAEAAASPVEDLVEGDDAEVGAALDRGQETAADGAVDARDDGVGDDVAGSFD